MTRLAALALGSLLCAAVARADCEPIGHIESAVTANDGFPMRLVDVAPPAPTHTRVVTRPTATPNPANGPILGVATNGPIILAPDVIAYLTVTMTALHPDVRRATAFVFPPGVAPNPKGTGTFCRKGKTTLAQGPQAIRCRLRYGRDPAGTWQACGHIPNEPGSAFNDLMICTPFEVRD
jgi:hypothetical protein